MDIYSNVSLLLCLSIHLLHTYIYIDNLCVCKYILLKNVIFFC